MTKNPAQERWQRQIGSNPIYEYRCTRCKRNWTSGHLFRCMVRGISCEASGICGRCRKALMSNLSRFQTPFQ